jgi:Domain of unknown function (DUF4265)
MPADRVKVLFRLEKDEDGYPPVEVESLWGLRRGEGIELDNIPFFAKGVAVGDIVKTTRGSDGALEFESVVRRGGHSTYRILLIEKQPDDPRRTMEELITKGLSVEEDAGLLAVDVPPEIALGPVRDYLFEGIDSGRWEVEEGYRAGMP